MKQSVKRGVSWLLTAAMLCGLVPAFEIQAGAAEEIAITDSITLENGKSYTLTANMSGKSITVPNGVTATVTVPAGANVMLNNRATGGSPIAVQDGGVLRLVINGVLTAYGQNGQDGIPATNAQSFPGGNGASAGICIPEHAQLLLFGSGIINSYGGDAGNGGSATTPVTNTAYPSPSGGGGAAAGIGGNGGNGGHGGIIAWCAGSSGVSAGTIMINEVTVNAFGGGGGSGGSSFGDGGGASAGGGGYAAAGIGGGGGGGSGGIEGRGGVGFSGGATYNSTAVSGAANGSGYPGETLRYPGGSGYFSEGSEATDGRFKGMRSKIGGLTIGTGKDGIRGGLGGCGSTVYVASTATVTAQNGSYITTASNTYANPTPIYAQLGYSLDDIRAAGITAVAGRTDADVSGELAGKSVPQKLTRTGVPGIGSGAGYVETSNGSYTVFDGEYNIANGSVNITEPGTYYVTGVSKGSEKE